MVFVYNTRLIHTIHGTLVLGAIAIGGFQHYAVWDCFFLTCFFLILSPFWLAWSLGVLSTLVALYCFSLRRNAEIGDDDILGVLIGAFLPVYYVVLLCHNHCLSG